MSGNSAKQDLAPFGKVATMSQELTVSATRVEAERLKKEVKYEGADPIEDRRRRAVNRAHEKASKVFVKDLFKRWGSD